MQRLHFERALLADGWAADVEIQVDDSGAIAAVVPDSPSPGALHGCLLPGVPNLHSHAHQRAMAGLAERAGPEGDDFWSWREVMYACLARLEPDHLEAVAAQLYVEMLKAGYTAVAEFHYLHRDPKGRPYEDLAEMSLRVVAAARAAGIGMTLLPALYSFGGFGAVEPSPRQRRFLIGTEGLLQIVSRLEGAGPDLAVGVAPHSLRAVDPAGLSDLVTATAERGVPIHIHVAEQQREVEECLAWSGQRPVEWLVSHFDVDARWCLVHATHADERETDALAATRAVAGLCPTTEANLADGVMDATGLVAAGGRFGVGSDSQVSVSPAEELRWLEYGQRLRHRRRNLLAGAPGRSTGRRLFEAALAGGAQACGRPIGRLEAGRRADFIVLDTDHPRLYGRTDDALLDSWIFAAGDAAIRDVWVGGVQIVSERRHRDEEAIADRFRQAIDALDP